MTPKELEAIKRRADAATPGPWDVPRSWLPFRVSADEVTVADTCAHNTPTLQKADAEFIAAARSDVPALLAEVERLQARLRTVVEVLDMWKAGDSAKEILIETLEEPLDKS